MAADTNLSTYHLGNSFTSLSHLLNKKNLCRLELYDYVLHICVTYIHLHSSPSKYMDVNGGMTKKTLGKKSLDYTIWLTVAKRLAIKLNVITSYFYIFLITCYFALFLICSSAPPPLLLHLHSNGIRRGGRGICDW